MFTSDIDLYNLSGASLLTQHIGSRPWEKWEKIKINVNFKIILKFAIKDINFKKNL